MGRKTHTRWINQAQVDAGGMNNWRMRRDLTKELGEGSWRKTFAKNLYEGCWRRCPANGLGEGGVSEGLKSVDFIINIRFH